MKKIFQIYSHDMKKIFKNMVALVVIIGLICLPCIYCWTNLLSSWSPYSDLQAIKIGMCSEDDGYTIGKIDFSIGEKIIESLEGNTTVGWCFYEDKEKMKQDLENGELYACFVIPDKFSEDLISFIGEQKTHPTIEYYENQKKNAIVPKITGKVKTTIQAQVNKTIISTVSEVMVESAKFISGGDSTFFQSINDKSNDLDASLDTYIQLLKSVSVTMTSLQNVIELEKDMVPATSQALDEAQSGTNNVIFGVSAAYELAKSDKSMLEDNSKKVKDQIDNCYSELVKLKEIISKDPVIVSDKKDELIKKIDVCIDDIWNLKDTYQDSLQTPAIYVMATTVSNIGWLVNSMDTTLSSVVLTLDEVNELIGDGRAAVDTTVELLENAKNKLEEKNNDLSAVAENATYKSIKKFLENNPTDFADFISNPTQIERITLYEISDEQGNSYASAMSSFYSVLAMYLSSLFCMVMIHSHVNEKHYSYIEGKLKNTHKFFGRWMVYATVSLCTSLVLGLGDLLFIEVQCIHPVAFVVSLIIIGLAYNFFVYSMAFGFGVVGEAIALVFMILSVSCSSSFPFEMLPSIFGKLNTCNLIVFQPGMNMLKECVAGFYSYDYWIYLLKLLSYDAVGLIAAFGISRIPLIHKLCEMIEERKNDSHVLL